jgi:O-antigen/teichoic acid export membrane protein
VTRGGRGGVGAGLVAAVVFAFASRAINLVATLVIVRVCVSALGLEQYGVLSTIIAITSFFAFGDFGLGLALMNKVAYGHATGDPDASRRAVSVVFAVVVVLTLLLLTLALGAYLLAHEAGLVACGREPCLSRSAVLAILALAILNVPFSLPVRVLYGLQRTILGQTWLTAGRLLTIGAVLATSHVAPTPEALGIAIVAAPLLLSIGGTLWFFLVSRPDLRPRRADVDRRGALLELRSGGGLAVLQALTYLDLGFDAVIVIAFFGAAEAGAVDLVAKLFMYIPALISVALAPLWPALAAAHAGGEEARSRRILAACYGLVASASTAGALLLAVFIRPAASLLLGVEIAPDPVLVWSLAAWGVLVSLASVQSVALNARDVVYAQLPSAVAFAVLVVALKIGFAAAGYLPGVALALAIVYPARLLLVHFTVTRRVA